MDKAPPHLLQAAAPHAALAATDAVLRCQAAMLARGPLGEAATALAAEVADLLQCRRVSVGLLQDGQARIAGSSQQVELDPRHDAAAAVLAAMHEAIDQRRVIAWPPVAGDTPISIAQRQLAGTGRACSVPLVAGERVMGALTLEREGMAFDAAQLALCEDIAAFAGPLLELKVQAEAPWRRRSAAWLRERLASSGRRHALVAGAVLVALAALALPWSWRVSAPARLEGSVQRAVVAPADGFLQQADVRPGDRVRAGQPLAQLSSQDLELERKRRESELRQHENAYRAALARNDRTQMVISQSRAAEAQALLELAETQLDRSRLVAPFDGVVIKGDLRQNLGAPVQKGETLLVLSPSESFRLIVEVDESDIAAVTPGQHGQLALAARPEQPLAFTTRRVVPVATAADGRNYFEVEAALDARAEGLRPGLSGVAKIEVGRRALGWLLFHRAVAWMRLALWSVAL